MTDYLLVETGGPSAGPGCDRFVGDAVRLAEAAGVTLLLLENGVAAAVRDAQPAPATCCAPAASCGWTRSSGSGRSTPTTW